MRTETASSLATAFALLTLATACQRRAERLEPVSASLPRLLVQAESRSIKRLDIGYGAGPLNSVQRYERALRTVFDDGFVHMRVYEPFKERDDQEFSMIVENLAFLSGIGFVPIFTLSNYPYDQLPDVSNRGRTAAYPEGRRRGVLEYSNRYPPRDLQRYGEQVQRLFQRLARELGREELARWYVEIGNEPDAARFFWGSRDEFRSILWTTIRSLRDLDLGLRVGGAAFTSGLTRDPSIRPGYAELAREINGSQETAFVSFHVYASSFPSDRPTAEYVNRLVPRLGMKIISEWNVSTQPDDNVQDILNSDRIMPYLIDMLGLCYDADVELLLIHKLMDDPNADAEQLGLFGNSGAPKAGYEYVRHVARLIENGYSVMADSTMTLVRGAESTLLRAGPAGLRISYEQERVIASSFNVADGVGQVPPDGWLLLERAQPRDQ